MRTTLDLPERLIHEAARLAKEKTKTGTVITALREYIRFKKLEKLADAAGTVKISPDYDWSAVRHGR